MTMREFRRLAWRASVSAPAIAVGLSMVAADAPAQTVLPDINVVAPTPLSGTRARPANPAPAPGSQNEPAATTATTQAAATPDPSLLARDKVPSNTDVLTSEDFNHTVTPTFLDAVNRALPGVFLSDQTGNPFQRDLNYRGFTASPVQGTPQGIAVYQNGVRINESWGDVVNWDFIPEKAIDKVTMFPSNPVFGLNAIGGAMSIQMKNGFTYQGTELESFAGSYGRFQNSVQVGKQDGNLSAYALFETATDNGWRDAASFSHLNRMYVDLGARNETTEFHLQFTGADDILGNVAATPIQLLQKSWSSVYTWPQDTHLQLAFINATLSHQFSDTLTFQGNAYYRGFWQGHNDGNGSDAETCRAPGTTSKQAPNNSPAGNAFLCIDGSQDNEPLNGALVHGIPTTPTPNTLRDTFAGSGLGEVDRNWVSSNTVGGTAQFTSSSKVFDHDNHLVVGASVDHGYTQFTASSEIGPIDPNTLFVGGSGIFINNPDAGMALTSLHAQNTYTGLFITDTFDITDRLSVTAGGRFNLAQINLQDQTGLNPNLNSNNQFERFNPMFGATYKITPNLTAYADYAEANRAPTPLELGCSDPNHPCMIDSFLVADPPLKQVVSHTIEAGLRGAFGQDAKSGLMTFGLGVYHTVSDNDIIEVGAPFVGGQVANFGFFQNFGKTLRQGVEAKATYQRDRLNIYANYTYVDATYQSSGALFSPNNPNAACNSKAGTLAQNGFDDDCVPTVNVKPGDHIGGIPAHRLKIGAEYEIMDKWKVGADLNVYGSQYFIHDDSNQFQKVPAYAVLNLHTSYQLTPNVQLFGMVNNALNQQYYLAGTFTGISGFQLVNDKTQVVGALNDPRTYLPGMPFAAYGGIRATF